MRVPDPPLDRNTRPPLDPALPAALLFCQLV